MSQLLIQVPEGDVAAVQAMIVSLATDLGLPVDAYTVNAGPSSIGAEPLVLRERMSVRDIVFASRGQLATTDVASKLSIDVALLERLIGAGVGVAHADTHHDFEKALDEAGGRIALRIHPDQAALFEPDVWSDRYNMMVDGLFYELGIKLGSCDLEIDPHAVEGHVQVQVNDLRLVPYPMLAPDKVLVNDTTDRLTLVAVIGEEAINPVNRTECAVIAKSDAETCTKAGLTTWTPLEHVILVLSAAIRRHAGALWTTTLTDYTLATLRGELPQLIETTRERYSTVDLTRLLRALVDEEIGARNLRHVLESLLAAGAPTTVDLSRFIVFGFPHEQFRSASLSDEESMVECLRGAHARYISHKYTRGGNTLVVYLLDPEIERRLTAGDVSLHEPLLRAVNSEMGSLPSTAQNPVILTTASIRARCRRLLRAQFPELSVLSYQELSPDMNIQPIARISLD